MGTRDSKNMGENIFCMVDELDTQNPQKYIINRGQSIILHITLV